MKIRVIIYIRVSTQEQAREGYSVNEQRERLIKYCEAMGWEIVEVYIDPGYSGGGMDRPGLKALIRRVEEGGIDKVVVYKLDRLSRSQKDTLYLIEDVFLKNNTDFVSMNENFDTSSSFGRAMIGILAVFAQLEREQIKERMGMGKEARAKEGKWNGGSQPPIGYRWDKFNDKFIVHEFEAVHVREAFDLFVGGMPLYTISQEFYKKGYTHSNKFYSRKTITHLLQNKSYLGFVKYRGEYFKAEHDPIISEDTFNKAQKIFEQRAELYPNKAPRERVFGSYLTGLLFCKHCGARYHKRLNSRTGTAKVYWYACYSRSKASVAMIKDPNCKNKNWKMVELDNAILEEIKKLAMDPDAIEVIKNEVEIANQSDEPNKVALIEQDIKRIDEQISRFMDLYGIGKFTIEQVSDKVDPLNDTRRNLQRELDALNAEKGRITVSEAREIVSTFEEIIERDDFDEIRLMIESLIYYIEIDHETITIHWRFA